MAATLGVRDDADTGPESKAPGSMARASELPAAQGESANTLLAFEADLRSLANEAELFAHWCNETRRFIHYRQAFLLHSAVHGAKPRLICATSLPAVDRDAPFVRWLEKTVCRMAEDGGLHRQRGFKLSAYCDGSDEETQNYPFSEFLWTPLIERWWPSVFVSCMCIPGNPLKAEERFRERSASPENHYG